MNIAKIYDEVCNTFRSLTDYKLIPELEVCYTDNKVDGLLVRSGFTSGMINTDGTVLKLSNDASPIPYLVHGDEAFEIKKEAARVASYRDKTLPPAFKFLSFYKDAETAKNLTIGIMGRDQNDEIHINSSNPRYEICLHRSGRCEVTEDRDTKRLASNTEENARIKSILREALIENSGKLPKGFEFLNKYAPKDFFHPKAA